MATNNLNKYQYINSTVTGQASKTINWVAFARVTESKIPV